MTNALVLLLLVTFVASVAQRLQANHRRTGTAPHLPAGADPAVDRDLVRVRRDLAAAAHPGQDQARVAPPVPARVPYHLPARAPAAAARPLARTDAPCPCR